MVSPLGDAAIVQVQFKWVEDYTHLGERACLERSRETDSQGHNSGDCRNLIKNDITKECTFVTNATTDTVPDGWLKMPENATPSSWVCPLGYEWTALAATIPTAAAYYGPVNVVSVIKDADYQVISGDYVSGWTWLKQPGQSASWTFYNLPIDRKLYIYLAPLVTRPSGLD